MTRYYHPIAIFAGAMASRAQTVCQRRGLSDDVINELIRTHPNSLIKDVAPTADFRITEAKVAREPRRYSGRTAMRAPLSVHEPCNLLGTPRSPFLWKVIRRKNAQLNDSVCVVGRWNSPQAWNKYQDHVGGHLKHGDPGIRLFDALKRNNGCQKVYRTLANSHAKKQFI